jgi:hypothetical protein
MNQKLASFLIFFTVFVVFPAVLLVISVINPVVVTIVVLAIFVSCAVLFVLELIEGVKKKRFKIGSSLSLVGMCFASVVILYQTFWEQGQRSNVELALPGFIAACIGAGIYLRCKDI